MARRTLITTVIAAAAVVIGACGGTPGTSTPTGAGGSPGASASPTGLTEVVEVTSYVGGVTSSAPHDYAGVTEGIYAKYKLKLNFVVLAGTSQAVQAVAADRTGFAFTHGDILDEMLIADQNPDAPPLIGIAAGAMRNPVGVMYLQSSGIKTPADLRGKKIGVPTGSLSEQYLDVFLAKQGVPKSAVTIVNTAFAAQQGALLTKQVDAIAAFLRAIASLEIAVPQGDKVGSFIFGDYNLPSPLAGVTIQKSLLDKNPAVARAIALASTESLHFCVVNPQKCVEEFVAQNQGRDIPQTLAEWKVAITAQYGFDTEKAKTMKPLQLGWYDAALIAKTLPELKTLFNIKKDFDPTTLYTNQFVERP
ncbi:MAG TPA: ABC transporter substrate-binding protein [Candidatus Limnocylindria bacterium]|jgi:NitT/TauT family transport system substrate-binding protein|nr:ABC transporter substrate-binding protein [Candidatus Limnocylindria bacterium]